ncbi:G-protein coupled receptor GRL101-like [Lytechinus pictus]|uniref:G-protein coupled receptor GRL101-like n=1 Tax=Lytechinus pictus TaxID=7653 RepID=UPI0030B9D882
MAGELSLMVEADEECPYRCRDSDICLLDTYQCDGWFDCPERDDEDSCEIAKCPDGYVCGEAPFNDINGPVNFCEGCVWQPFWVNATRPWKKEDIKNTAKKAVILNLGENLIEFIAPGTFQNLSKLTDLVITSLSPKSIPLYTGIFDGLDSLSALYVYDSRFCCLVPDTVKCIEERPPHPLFTCRKTFLQNHTIKVFIWILGISALVGNFFVLVLRLRSTPTTRVARIQSMIITNLALSDLLMGVYMVLLAVMDIYIGESYFWAGRAEEWRASITCQIAGFISVLSTETSVFLLILLTIDRFICVVFPFSKTRLGITSTRVAIAVIWVASILLSVAGLLLQNISPDAYGLSDVCVGLPFIRKSTDLQAEADTRTTDQYGIPYFTTIAGSTESTWTYSIIIFLGINLCSFIIILLLYIGIFIKVRFVRAEVGRTNQSSNEVKMALKMLLIVGTDFCCWMPIIIIGILVQTVGVQVTPDIYAWLVVFVLPINSSLNPYLYTIINLVSK